MAHHGGGVFWMLRLIVNPFVGVSVPARAKLIELGGEIAKARMAKDVKVVKNIKTSVTSFRDIHANGHSST
jgi:hypothetical protein